MRKMLVAIFAASLLALCLSAKTANAQEVEACPPGGDATKCRSYLTIQEAVNDAAPNSIIYLSNGTHKAAGVDITNKDLTIRGEDARETIVQAATIPCADKEAKRVFRIASARVSIEDLTIENGCILSPEQPGIGGGIWNSGSLTLKRVIVRNNTIKYDGLSATPESWTPMGAGIYSVGSLEIVNSAILSNVVSSPNNIAMGGGIYNNGRSHIVNSTISGNQVIGAGGLNEVYQGGGIFNAGTLIMEYTTLVLNVALTAGGGLYSTGEVEVANNLFYANSAIGGEAECVEPVVQAGSGAQQQANPSECELPELGQVYLGDLYDKPGVPIFIPSPDSASIDQGVCALSKIKVDQRGNRRGQGRECDLGAAEAGASFMPTAFTALPQPDLIVREVTVEPAGQLNAGTQATVKVVIENVGNKATSGGFFIDLFINPREAPPNYAGATWTDLCRTNFCVDDEGVVWLAPPTIYPNERFTFSSNIDLDPYAVRQSSKWDKYFPEGEVRLWAFVDSYSANRSPQGNVVESNEGNNRYEVKAFTVLPGRIPPFAASSAAQPSADLFAPRPQP